MKTPKPIPPGTLVISNMDKDDVTYQSDVGWWNATRAKRDCAAGKHKKYLFDVEELYRANATVEVDRDNVEALVRDDTALFAETPILIGDFGKVWLITEHERIHAMHQRKIRDCLAFVIEEEDAQPYRIIFQGNLRKPPWEIQ
jgi:hypothetical protein